MSRKSVLENDVASLLNKRRFVGDIGTDLRNGLCVDGLFQHFRKVFDGLFQVGLVVLEQGRTVALLEAKRRSAMDVAAKTVRTSRPWHTST
jgi:hypothetical protein